MFSGKLKKCANIKSGSEACLHEGGVPQVVC